MTLFDNKEGKGEMIKAPIELQDLRRKIYIKAKADFGWKRWSRESLFGRSQKQFQRDRSHNP